MAPARRIGCIGMLALVCGCQANSPKEPSEPVAATTAATPQGTTKFGFTATCPADWKAVQKGGDYALAASPKDSAGLENDPIVAIQVPQLPPHIPGFLPLGGVASGYVQDLKKRYPDQKVDEQSTVKLDGSDARRFVSSFKNKGKPWRELALLAVHGDHVYVITGNCDASVFDKTKSAFDALVTSLKWTDKS